MASKHPLDVFRSTGDGFAGASRSRRTVPGKIIASTIRRAPAGPARTVPLSAGRPKQPRRPLLPPRPATAGLTRHLFFGAVALVAVVALVVVIQQTWHDGGVEPEIPTLKLSDVLPGPPAPPEPTPAPEGFTIIAATYAGSDNGERLAAHTQAELHQRLYPDVMVIGYPEPGQPGVFRSYAVLVGQADSEAELQDELQRLRAIDDWQGGKPAPFVSARIVPYPTSIGGG